MLESSLVFRGKGVKFEAEKLKSKRNRKAGPPLIVAATIPIVCIGKPRGFVYAFEKPVYAYVLGITHICAAQRL